MHSFFTKNNINEIVICDAKRMFQVLKFDSDEQKEHGDKKYQYC